MSAAKQTPESPTAQRGIHCVQRLVWCSDLVRKMTREQVSAVLYDKAKIGHYTFDKTVSLKKWLRQALRSGDVKISDLRRYMRKLPNTQAHARREQPKT